MSERYLPRQFMAVLASSSALCGLLFACTFTHAQALTKIPVAYATPSSSASFGSSQAQNQLHILSYHDIIDAAPGANPASNADAQSISLATLVQHFSWLRDNGYRVVSVDQVLAARSGGAPLPARAVMLTFDDAYSSFYTSVFPLLTLFDYPATLSVVGIWVEPGVNNAVVPNESAPIRRYMTWRELADVAASGRVEIASHSFDLHRGVIANPQRNLQPSATALRYDVLTGKYENNAEQAARIEGDLRRNSELLTQRLGKAPRVMTWPYGAHSPANQSIALKAGMPVGLTLENGINTALTPLGALGRILVRNDSDASDIERAMRPIPVRSERVLTLDLDTVFDVDNGAQERNLDALLERVRALAPTTVYLRASSRHNDAAGAPLVYFPTQQLALRADLFNRAAWQLRVRLGVAVYAWLPLTSLPNKFHAPDATINGGALATLYADLVTSVPLAGLHFSDADPADDARVVALVAHTKRLRNSMRISRQLELPTSSDAGSASAVSTWIQRAKGADWIVASPPDLGGERVATGNPASVPGTAAESLMQPRSARALRRARAFLDQWRAMGLPIDQIIWRADSNTDATAKTLTALHAAGARHLSYGSLEASAATHGALRTLISSQTSPTAHAGNTVPSLPALRGYNP